MATTNAPILWTASQEQIARTHMTAFGKAFFQDLGRTLPESYDDLHQASLRHPDRFWRCLWNYADIPGTPGSIGLVSGERMIDAQWFPEGQINFGAAMLHPHRLSDPEFANATAIIARDEVGRETRLTRQALFDRVMGLASFFLEQGVVAGDRIAAVVPNNAESVIAMIATTCIGAIWSSCSPEFGEDAICDRFGQIEPKLLITCAKTTYNNKPVEPITKVLKLVHRLPTLQGIVVAGETESLSSSVSIHSWDAAIRTPNRVELKPFPFAHPLCIVYSSGTTGVPKCIVHGTGGTVLQHVKEHQLHCDIHPGDTLFYYTTTGWMMWNWLISGLISQATVVLFDGSPFACGPETLWRLADEVGITHFGAGARYYATQEKENYQPRTSYSLHSLRCILSTGSPLLPNTFDWLYQAIGKPFNLASISGGTDILSCFVLGNPNLPVRRGEIQCKGLGMDVQVWNEHGERQIEEPGELVCARPFPSMPIHFWNDPDDHKYLGAYFSKFPNVWCHGDWAQESAEGGYVIFGRSDATLNPSGVRIGTAEIYQQLETFSEVQESLATVLRRDGDEQIVLFVKLREGAAPNRELADAIRRRLRERCSPRHVPVYLDYAPDLPKTISGKLSEIAVRSAISGCKLGNAGALANPECIRFFEQWQPNRIY